MRKGRITSPGSALIHLWLQDKKKAKDDLKSGWSCDCCHNVMTLTVSRLDYNEPSIIFIGGDKIGTPHPYD